MLPGSTELQRMPCAAYCTAMFWLSCSTPKGRDTAARYGGEEFAIILPDTALNDGVTVAEHIRTILGRRPVINRVSGQRLGVVTCSIGVAQYRSGEPVGELVNRADQSLYRAKREGRNTVRAEELVGTGSAASASH
jgi:diguanylate cyclase